MEKHDLTNLPVLQPDVLNVCEEGLDPESEKERKRKRFSPDHNDVTTLRPKKPKVVQVNKDEEFESEIGAWPKVTKLYLLVH